MTSFQIRCEGALIDLLQRYRRTVELREVLSNRETFIHLALEEPDLEVWIYDDEAEYRFGRMRRNFESVVFKDEEERIRSFLVDLEARL